MEAEQVLALLERMTRAGVRAWVAGGWAVDAVVGRQTRPHGDLDLAVDDTTLDTLLRLMRHDGFSLTTDWRPTRMELSAPDGRVVDVHPVVIAPDGTGVQAGLDGQTFSYAAEGFGVGSIDGRRVPCLTVQQQLRLREGYEPRPVDLHDIALLETLAVSESEARPSDG